MTKLSVNVNKIATLRNARGGNMPNLIQVCKDIISYGAQGITVHPRPDERHIKKQDVYDINDLLQSLPEAERVEFNIEGYPSQDYIQMIKDITPEQCTLVPDPPDVITSNAGWKAYDNKDILTEVVNKIKPHTKRVSVFIDPYDFSEQDLQTLVEIGVDRIELYTEKYAQDFNTKDIEPTIKVYKKAAVLASRKSIEINAGHDLNLKNINYLVSEIPEIKEVSIGHALICESLYDGLKPVIQNYLKELKSS
ncbi:MAG: pyridoxine 5'-phosphate synthase [Bdellovibrionales bacterium]|nr:pyridoxine 5'-phosphate synthase [Bdellovibrionales bacterium]